MRILSLIIIGVVLSYNVAQGSYSIESPKVSATSSGGNLFTEVRGDLLTVDIRDVDLKEVLKQISDQHGITFFLPPSLEKEKVMVRFLNLKLDEGLNKILASYNRIFIYSEEDHNLPESPITRLTEVRIYPRFKKGNLKGRLEVASVIHPKASKPSAKDTKKYAKESGARKGRKSVKALAKALKSEAPTVRAEAVKELAKIGNAKAVGLLNLALKDKNTEVKNLAKNALEKIGGDTDIEERNDEDASQIGEEGADPLPSGGGDLAFAIEPGEDSLEPGKQGLDREVDILLNNVPEQLITAGFWITYDPSMMSIVGADIYDGSALAGPWDNGMTNKVTNPNGPGTYMVTVGNLGSVTPDGNSNINIAKVKFHCTGTCDSPITISTISGFDTVVGNGAGVYDPNINPTTVTLY